MTSSAISFAYFTHFSNLKNLTHPVCNARFYYCFHPVNPDISCHIWATGLILPRGKTLGLVNSMNTDVESCEKALDITGEEISEGHVDTESGSLLDTF